MGDEKKYPGIQRDLSWFTIGIVITLIAVFALRVAPKEDTRMSITDLRQNFIEIELGATTEDADTRFGPRGETESKYIVDANKEYYSDALMWFSESEDNLNGTGEMVSIHLYFENNKLIKKELDDDAYDW